VDTHVYGLRFAGELIEITKVASDPFDQTLKPIWQYRRAELAPEISIRGAVTQLSQRSRRRLAKACAAIAWGAQPLLFRHCDVSRNVDDRRSSGQGGPQPAPYRVDSTVRDAHGGVEDGVQRPGAPHFHLAIAEPLDRVPMPELCPGCPTYSVVGESWVEVRCNHLGGRGRGRSGPKKRRRRQGH